MTSGRLTPAAAALIGLLVCAAPVSAEPLRTSVADAVPLSELSPLTPVPGSSAHRPRHGMTDGPACRSLCEDRAERTYGLCVAAVGRLSDARAQKTVPDGGPDGGLSLSDCAKAARQGTETCRLTCPVEGDPETAATQSRESR
ncbi:MAG: hypothetical protein WBA35_02925 [Litorimonas sp.]